MPRIAWHDLPRLARSAVHECTGPVLAAANVSTGANSGLAVKLHTQTGPVFVKGILLDHPQVKTQAREADINPYLPVSAPRLLWHVQAGGWDLLGFELVDGRIANYAPGSPDLPLVVTALEDLAATGCPDIPLLDCAQRYAAYTDRPELFAGDALLHTDMAPHNVLVDNQNGGVAHLIDWAWPTRGAGWVDAAVWIIRLVDAGHAPKTAEEWTVRLPAWQTAPSSAVTVFAQANACMWQEIATHSTDVQWQKRMAVSARLWAEYREAGMTEFPGR
nr:aminoglycoside phosphotransferase [Streptomyces sp. 846.5]